MKKVSFVKHRAKLLIAAIFIFTIMGSACDQLPGQVSPIGSTPVHTTQTPAPTEVPTPTPQVSEEETEAFQMRLNALFEQTDNLADGYYYDEAIEALDEFGHTDYAPIISRRAQYAEQKNALVKYDGQIFHVFFHSLIIYPELAFDSKSSSPSGYNKWMTTVSEFKAMLPLLLENGFVLYDITELVSIDDQGNAVKKDIYLPEGKKPLIISIDDVCYYDYMKGDGFASRLRVNDQGDVVTEVEAPDGTVSDTYDGDVMPILDQFVKEHPAFSYQGAKGIVAVTGYQGAFGYRITDLGDYSEDEGQQMLSEVAAVSKRLRETGWHIACHSYTHNANIGDLTVSLADFKYDVDRWERFIEPYVGDTCIYVSPFGVSMKESDERYQYLLDQGFYIYCSVSSYMTTFYQQNGIVQERMNIDGTNMILHPERISKYLFDPTPIVDPARPPLE